MFEKLGGSVVFEKEHRVTLIKEGIKKDWESHRYGGRRDHIKKILIRGHCLSQTDNISIFSLCYQIIRQVDKYKGHANKSGKWSERNYGIMLTLIFKSDNT